MGLLRLHWLLHSSNRTSSNRVVSSWGSSSGRCCTWAAMACTSRQDRVGLAAHREHQQQGKAWQTWALSNMLHQNHSSLLVQATLICAILGTDLEHVHAALQAACT